MALSLFALTMTLSCSQSSPRISSLSARLVYRWVSGAPVERLSLFVLGNDDDGQVDLAELYLLNDEAQLYWSMESENWVTTERSGDTWIGAHELAMVGDAPFPRGTYRIVLVDKGGLRTERTFSLDQPNPPSKRFPTLSVSAGRYRVSSEYPKNTLLVYGPSGAALRMLPLKTAEGTLSELNLPKDAKSFALWAEDEGNLTAALTQPVDASPLDEGRSRP